MKRLFLTALTCFLCALLASTLVMAQTATTGQITGTVKDPTGAVIAGAKLMLTSAAGEQRMATSNGEGYYRFPLLPPGVYKLVIEAQGFKPATFDNIGVRITQSTDLEAALTLAGATEAVSITAEPPLVELDKAATGRVIGESAIAQAPLPTRNFQQLLALSPGAVSGLSNNTELGRGDANIFVNGQRGTSNNVVVDGTGVNSPGTNSTPNISVPSPDAIQEFIVQTSMYDATQGRNAGGNVAVVTKSGTNAFHGDVFEFLRNNKLNANDFFLNQKGVPRPRLTRNQFGGTVGGPLVKDKTFFFLSYQGTRERNGASLSNSLSFPFLPAGLTDDRSDTTLNSLAVSMGAVIPGTTLPYLSTITKKMLQAKLPNGQYMIPSAKLGCPPGAQVCAAVVPSPTTLVSSPQSMISQFQEDQFNVNIDQNVGQKNKLAGKFFYSADPQFQGIGTFVGSNAFQLPGFGTDIEFQNRVFSLADTHIFSPNLINQARFGFSRINGPSHPEEPFKNSDFGINNPLCAASGKFCGISTIYVANMFTIGGYSLADQRSTTETFEWGDMVSYTKGRHSLKFGGDVVRYRVNFFFNFFSRGQMQFSSFKNFLMGVPDYGLLGNGIRDRHYRATDLDLYLQDDFRVTPQFTVNAGLRLARNGGISDTDGRLVNFNPDLFSANTLPCTVAAPCTKGFTNVTGTLNPNDWNLAPRLGFSWKPVASKNLVVRGGGGVYFDRFSTRVANLQIFNYPYDIVGLSAPYIPALIPQFFANPYPDLSKVTFPVTPATIPSPVPYYASGVPLTGTSTAISGLYVSPNFRTPYVYQYNLGVQYEFVKNWLLELGYVGSTGRKLLDVYTFSQGATGTAPFLTAYGFTNNKALNGFQQARTDANSNYNSLQTSLTKRFKNGLQFLASYTWSKSIDDISGAPTNEFIALPGDQQNPAASRAASDFNRPQRFVFSGLYDVPKFYKGDSRIAKRVVNEWQLSTVMAFQAGQPFTVSCTSGSTTYNRADLTATDYRVSGSVESRLGGYFNPLAFAPTCTNAAPYGTSPRNFIYGPGQKNVDFSLVKFIPVTERTKVEFRTEFFNAFNFVNFANPISSFTTGPAATNASYAALARIVSTSTGPRVIQFALKLSF